MIQKVFVIFDLNSKTAHSSLMLGKDEKSVKRNLIVYKGNLSKSIQAFPNDFAVFCLGEYDDEKMQLFPKEQAEMCFSLKEVTDYVGPESNV